ncbi:hypothetical protein [Neptuniibacter sp. QD37_11]|uniref:hypothetical protein n=1 Tax=Neptuniibacter sp. QD37_11 TaxID=3398209 RepID=UPI0039F644A2
MSESNSNFTGWDCIKLIAFAILLLAMLLSMSYALFRGPVNDNTSEPLGDDYIRLLSITCDPGAIPLIEGTVYLHEGQHLRAIGDSTEYRVQLPVQQEQSGSCTLSAVLGAPINFDAPEGNKG